MKRKYLSSYNAGTSVLSTCEVFANDPTSRKKQEQKPTV